MYRRFLSRSQTEDLVDALEDDAFDIVGSYLGGEITSAGLTKAAKQLGIAASKINAVLQAFSGYVKGVNLINNLNMRLTLKYESGFTETGKVTNGVMVDVYDDGWNGPYADILGWTSGKMVGPTGSRGYFRAPNYDQIDDFVSGEV